MTRTNYLDILGVAGALGCGAIGGVFFAFSSFVMTGLGRLPDAEGIAAMKSINVTAVRPLFMIGLFGTAIVCVALIVQAVRNWGDRYAALLLAGAVVYLVGIIVVTIAYHVPRNDRLAELDPRSAGAAAQWQTYLGQWTAMNHVRTVAGLLAMLLIVFALVSRRTP